MWQAQYSTRCPNISYPLLDPRNTFDLVSLNEKIKKERPGVTTILWDYKNSYYSWGILASAGAYVFTKNGPDYDLKCVERIPEQSRDSPELSL